MARPNYAPFPRMIAASALLVLSGCATAQPLGVAPAETETTASVPVAPWMGPLGPAAMTAGGRGGEIVRVTSLESDGPGTLRAALEADGPKIIVFEVGGVIDLEDKKLECALRRGNRIEDDGWLQWEKKHALEIGIDFHADSDEDLIMVKK